MNQPLNESIVEDAALSWFDELGYTVAHGPDIAPGEPAAERDSFADVVLTGRLREAIDRLNSDIPLEARDEALRKVLLPDSPSLVGNNRKFHKMLRDGVEVEYRRDDGSIKGGHVRLIDFEDVEGNDWLAVNQFTVIEGQHNRRPDIVVFVNGLPLAVIELKNAVDEDATIWSAWNQLQTYKSQIPSLFNYNELLVVSDGLEARVGSLTANKEWFKVWLYQEIVALRPDWAGAPDDDIEAERDKDSVVKIVMTGSASDELDWQQHVRTKRKRKELASRFKDAKDPFRIVIVRDMWLTGFDAPCLHTMYIDKPMRGHGLMQAIARVNRVFKDKPGGHVVDYLGLADRLKAALATYTESGGVGTPSIDIAEAVAVLLKLAKQMRDATQRGAQLGLNDDEICFYDALAVNESAVRAMGIDELKVIAAELVTSVRKSVTIDWTVRESARAKIRVMVRRIVQVRLSTGPASRGDEVGTGAGRGVVRGLGDVDAVHSHTRWPGPDACANR